ncbi:DedA family protein [Ligilactobacillus pobuzihii]|nr:DedA family protein [Ligilactobacillus pobuzihii]GEN47653.1 alkaline phosphatase [Ligilactobacillus pobuzihii]
MNTEMITAAIDQYGYLGVVFLIALENVFPPIPSEVVLVFAGYSTLHTNLGIFGATFAATFGAYIGALILYVVGRFLNVDQLKRFASSKVGKIIRLKEADIDKTASFFNKHGGWTILFGRCVPVIRSLISIPAGMTKYPLGKFSLLTIGGTLLWNFILINLGHYAGKAWRQMLVMIDEWLYVLLAFTVIIVVVIWLVRKVKKKA